MRSDEMREVLGRLAAPVYRYCLMLTRDSHMAEDLTQETALRAWTHRRRIRSEQEALAWMLRTAKNAWTDEGRRRRVRTRAQRFLSRINPPQDPREDGSELVERAIDLLRCLPARQRDVLHLSAVEGLSNAQIARALQMSEGAVKSSLSLARARLRSELNSTHLAEAAQERGS